LTDDLIGTIREAEDKALAMLREAENNASRLIAEAEQRGEDRLEEAQRAAQSEISDLRDRRLVTAEVRLDDLEGSMASVEGEAARLRDEVVPAMVGRSDVLLERIAAEVDEVGSLTERLLRGEPLPIPDGHAVDEAKLAAALAEVQPALLEAFRGSEAEIRLLRV